MKAGQRVITVSDRTLVAALLTAGARLDAGDELTVLVGDGNARSWNFLERTATGESVRDLVGIYDAERDITKNAWVAANNQHEFAVAWAAIHNRQWVQKIDKETTPSVIIKRGSSVAIIGPKLDARKQDVILSRIGV